MVANKTLFDIGEDVLALERIITDADGDITDPVAAAAIEAWFSEIQANQGKKIDGYINLIRKWEGENVVAKAEAEQYQKRAKVRENRVAAFKDRLKRYMDATRQTKIDTPTGRTVAIQNNGGVTPMQLDTTVDPSSLDKRFQKINLDPEAIYKALTAGEKLDFASLLPRGQHLRIR